jgi:hypothetical protein
VKWWSGLIEVQMQNVRCAEELCQVSEHMLELHLNRGPLLGNRQAMRTYIHTSTTKETSPPSAGGGAWRNGAAFWIIYHHQLLTRQTGTSSPSHLQAPILPYIHALGKEFCTLQPAITTPWAIDTVTSA